MPMPYAHYVGDRDPVGLLIPTLDDYRTACARLSDAQWNQPWQPGKWTVRQIMVHVAQWEMIFGYRTTCAVSMKEFAIQGADQDALMARTALIDGPTAFAAFDGARRMNAGLIQSLSATDRAVAIKHPEYGTITVNDIIVQIVGHGMHHLPQIQATASATR